MINKRRILLLSLPILLIIWLFYSFYRVYSLRPTEEFPHDDFLQHLSNKKALVIVAHDDDNSIMGGTIAKLNASGWEIKQLSLLDSDTARNTRHKHATSFILDSVEFIDLGDRNARIDLDTVQFAYMPIPRERIAQIYRRDTIEKVLLHAIHHFQPSIIFSSDSEIGGYGHPDHIFMGGLVEDICQKHSSSVQRIYQAVYPNSMEKKIIYDRLGKKMKAWGYPSPYHNALKMYQITGMPEPTVQINIQDQSKAKMDFLRAYGPKERQNIRKFIPYYESTPHWLYFSIFDREFFRVVECP